MVKISIIIPFKNSEKTIQQCLDSLINLKAEFFEVILVENNCRDSSLDLARNFAKKHSAKLRIKIIKEIRPGASAARNAGAKTASGRYFVFTDSDCVVTPNWLADMMVEFKDQQVGAVAGGIRGLKACGIIDAFHGLFTLPSLPENKTYHTFSLNAGGFPTANLAVRKEVFNAIGGFDETIKIYGEDYDLCARIYKRGYKIHYTTTAIVYHIHRSSLKSTMVQSFGFGKSHALLLDRYFRKYLLIEFGFLTVRKNKFFFNVWINLAAADKKLAYLVALSVFYQPFSFLIVAYFVYLAQRISKKCGQRNSAAGWLKCFAMAGLLLVKSTSMTMGRVWGALQYGVLCV